MGKRRIVFTERKITSRIRDGYGQGSGPGYDPWSMVGHFPSLGRCNRTQGKKINREFHLFSDLEQDYLNHLEWCDNIVDIREQFPLFPVCETEHIASSMKYKHPKRVGGNNSFVMTTDFLITVKNGKEKRLIALSVKYAKELEDDLVLQKLSIEKVYWERRGIPWQIITEDSINRTRCHNIGYFLAKYEYPLTGTLDEENASEPMRRLIEEILIGKGTLSSITNNLDSHFKLKGGSMLSLFYYLAAHKRIPVFIDDLYLPTNPIESLVDIPLLKERLLLEEREYASTS